MDAAHVLIYIFFGLIIILALSVLFSPVRIGLKLAINAAFGFFGLVIAGLFGNLIGISISINFLTVFLTTVFGIYGLLLVFLLNIFI